MHKRVIFSLKASARTMNNHGLSLETAVLKTGTYQTCTQHENMKSKRCFPHSLHAT